MSASSRARRRTVFIAVIAAAAALTAACSSSSGSAQAASSTAKGSPITVGGWYPTASNPIFFAPEAEAGLQAAISSINAAGGVKGHPLKLDFCDEMFNPDKEADCARQMVSGHVSAVLYPQVEYPADSLPILEKADIPVIASDGATSGLFTCSTCYPLAGDPGWFYGSVALLLKSGATKIAVIGSDVATSQFAVSLAVNAIKSAGLQPVRTVTIPSTTTDYAAAATEAVAGSVDGIVSAVAPATTPGLVSALEAAGYKGKYASYTVSYDQQTVQALGSKGNGLLGISLSVLADDPSNAAAKQFRADMAKYQPSAQLDDVSLQAWGSVKLFASIAEGLSNWDSSTVANAMKNLKDVDAPAFGGFTTAGVKSPLPEYPQLLHTLVQGATIENGKIAPDGGLFDPWSALAEYKASH